VQTPDEQPTTDSTTNPLRVGTILLAHGSARHEQQPVIEDLAQRVAQADAERAGSPATLVGTRSAFLDHHSPTLAESVAGLVREGAQRIVVVPTLLSDAFHAREDVPKAVSEASRLLRVPIDIADPLGVDPVLFDVVDARVTATGLDDLDIVVVAAAGTGVAAARDRFRATMRSWRGRRPWRLNAAFIAGGDPSVGELVASLVDQGLRVVVVPFLLGSGSLERRAQEEGLGAGALAVTDVLGPAPQIVDLVRERRDARLSQPS
jgi:sirohydrochlorin ferrochelatase